MNHGFLTKRQRTKINFEEKYAKKMALDLTKITINKNKVEIFSFNKDLLFTLKARIFLLRNIVNSKVFFLALKSFYSYRSASRKTKGLYTDVQIIQRIAIMLKNRKRHKSQNLKLELRTLNVNSAEVILNR